MQFYKDDLVTEYVEKRNGAQGPFRYLDEKIFLSQIDRPRTTWVRPSTSESIIIDSSGASATSQFNFKTNGQIFYTNSIRSCETHLGLAISNTTVNVVSGTDVGVGIIVEPYALLQQLDTMVNGQNLTKSFSHPWRFACNEVLDLPLSKNMMNGYKYGAQVQYNQAEPIPNAQTSTVACVTSGLTCAAPAYIPAKSSQTFLLPMSIIASLPLNDTDSLLPIGLLSSFQLTLYYRQANLWSWSLGTTPISPSLSLGALQILTYSTSCSEEIMATYRDLYNTGRLVHNTFEKFSTSLGVSIFPNQTAMEITFNHAKKYAQTCELVLEANQMGTWYQQAWKSLTTCNPDIQSYWVKINGENTSDEPIYVAGSLQAYEKYQNCRHTRFVSQHRGEDLADSTMRPSIYCGYRTGRALGLPSSDSSRTDTGCTFSSALRMCEQLSSVDSLPWSGKYVQQVSYQLTTGSGSFYRQLDTNGGGSDTAITNFNAILLEYCRAQLVLSRDADPKILPYM